MAFYTNVNVSSYFRLSHKYPLTSKGSDNTRELDQFGIEHRFSLTQKEERFFALCPALRLCIPTTRCRCSHCSFVSSTPKSISSRFREFRHKRSEIRTTKLVLGSRPARDALLLLLLRRPLQSGKCIPPHPLARSPFEETTYALRLRAEIFDFSL